MTATGADEQQPCFVHCRKCKHEFVACHLPLEVREFVRQLRSMSCPQCNAASADIAMGKFDHLGATPTPITCPSTQVKPQHTGETTNVHR